MSDALSSRRVAVFMPSLTGGGAERVLLTLSEEFVARGLDVDLVLTRVRAGHDRHLPAGMRIIRLPRGSALSARLAAARAAGDDWPLLVKPVFGALAASWAIRYLEPLAQYLAESKPRAMIAANSWPNLTALWARRLSGARLRIVVTEHVNLSARVGHLHLHARWRRLPALIGRFYREADGIVAVSEGVARDLADTAGLPPDRVVAIPNPIVSMRLQVLAEAPIPHPWLAEGQPPVILGVGRLHPQKDFPTLLRAFAKVRRSRDARLVLLGEGAERARLQRLSADLGIADEVALAGHVENPFAYMSRAGAFVLSSRYEGLPSVLIQAIACGCPVVSTDCPSGPQEILDGGRLGPLVPVGDAEALARGILQCLASPPSRSALRSRAENYSIEASTNAYLAALLGGGAVW